MEEKLKDTRITICEEFYMVCNKGIYFKIGLKEGRILSKLINRKSIELIAKEENLTLDELFYIINTFESNGVIGEKLKEKFNLLNIKIPLFDIDSQLEKVCNLLRKYRGLLYTTACLFIFLIIFGGLTIILVFDDIFKIENLILPFWQYILIYFIYTFIIFCHEMGHGIACKFFGGKVGKIGIAFILFNPAMYCDISSIREFNDRHKQILCCFAGFVVNAVYIGVFSLLYFFNPCNFYKALIILNTTSILINAIPFIRLDGYWILSFGSGIQNLYNKSLRKITDVKKILNSNSREDYFLLVYGVVSGLIILYCIAKFGLGIWSLFEKII